MNPKSVAVAGASNTPTKTGSIQSLSLLKDDYQGKVYISILKKNQSSASPHTH